MKTLLTLVTLSLSLTLVPKAFAFNGDVDFSYSEVMQHRRAIPQILQTAAGCLDQNLEKHRRFIQRYGVSAFYGENASFAKVVVGQTFEGAEVKRNTTDDEKRDQLRQMGFQEDLVQGLVPSHACHSDQDCPLKMEAASCVGLALKCLQEGFASAGEQNMWNRLRAFTRANGVTGNSLQYGLQKLGWKLVYWNPDVSQSAAWDASERANYPTNPKFIWGKHVQNLNNVMRNHQYLDLHIDDVDGGINFGTGTPEITRGVPFFVGIAHMGYHVFPGTFGQVVEAHSTRAITDPKEVQLSAFSPLTANAGPQGGPRSRLRNGFQSDTYRSGVIAIPPGY
jgi:hypothetical protein